MTFRESAAVIGSGTVPLTRPILPVDQRGGNNDGRGERGGLNVVVINPEDLLSAETWATSTVSVTTSATLILGPANNPLPRNRKVIVKNQGTNAVTISPTPTIVAGTGWTLEQNEERELELMWGASIYGIAAAGTSNVDFIVY